MCQLFYYPRNASFAPHMLLAEMQLNYELIEKSKHKRIRSI
jgi:glutathione S-transferase